jgi:putative transposase
MRRARLAFPEVPLHIIQRGNNRQPCFSGMAEYVVYLHMLGHYAKVCGCAVHAYVLMSNHVHLLLSPKSSGSASTLMKQLGQRYVQYFNRRHHRSGTLWEGRFRSCLVQDEKYFMVCQRYIELNPVRACMVAAPGDYRWSSFQANAFGRADHVVAPHPIYCSLAADAQERQKRYRAMFAEALPTEMVNHLRHASNGNYAFGDPGFEQQMALLAGRPVSRQSPGRKPYPGPKTLMEVI